MIVKSIEQNGGTLELENKFSYWQVRYTSPSQEEALQVYDWLRDSRYVGDPSPDEIMNPPKAPKRKGGRVV